jgi:F-type H+-transporting ATPase subunit epsilon
MVLQVELVSPERIVFSGEAQMVIARTVGGGDIAFLDGHTPFVGALDIATATIRTVEGDQRVALHGGFVEVSSEPIRAADAADVAGREEQTPGARTRVTILSDVAELSADIDVERARQAKERAEKQLEREHDAEAEAALRRAHARLLASGHRV